MTALPPIALIIFNRPDLAARQVELLSRLDLTMLFVIADGPRPGRGEAERCAEARRVIDEHPWSFPVARHYAPENLGCARRIVSGIDWVFRQVDRAVILEDDCLAHPSFFRFAGELLEKYAADDRVMHICGTQPLAFESRAASYWFSHHVSCWGWASWARAWTRMDLEMRIPAGRRRELLQRFLFHNGRAVDLWDQALEKTRRKELDAWDYPWQLSIWRCGGLSVFPCWNLVSNIGFRDDATHTKDHASRWAQLPVREMETPLRHPAVVASDERFDRMFVDEVFSREGAESRPAARRLGLIERAKKLFSRTR
jgi:hypothetical protein